MNREKYPIKIGFPFDLYLKQLFFTDAYVRYINPFSFWHRYKLDRLETCYELNTVQYLERCHQLDWQLAIPTKTESDRYIDPVNSLIQQAKLNTICISQPLIELKYRGVSYYTRDILNININVVKSNSLKCTDKSDNISTPEKSSSN